MLVSAEEGASAERVLVRPVTGVVVRAGASVVTESQKENSATLLPTGFFALEI